MASESLPVQVVCCLSFVTNRTVIPLFGRSQTICRWLRVRGAWSVGWKSIGKVSCGAGRYVMVKLIQGCKSMYRRAKHFVGDKEDKGTLFIGR